MRTSFEGHPPSICQGEHGYYVVQHHISHPVHPFAVVMNEEH